MTLRWTTGDNSKIRGAPFVIRVLNAEVLLSTFGTVNGHDKTKSLLCIDGNKNNIIIQNYRYLDTIEAVSYLEQRNFPKEEIKACHLQHETYPNSTDKNHIITTLGAAYILALLTTSPPTPSHYPKPYYCLLWCPIPIPCQSHPNLRYPIPFHPTVSTAILVLGRKLFGELSTKLQRNYQSTSPSSTPPQILRTTISKYLPTYTRISSTMSTN
ncbi:unnamed protein product [Absidia cylindrospora]